MIPIEQLPTPPTAASALADALRDIFGDDLVAVWLHGGTTFHDRPEVPGDLDVTGIIAEVADYERDPARWEADPESRAARVVTVEKRIAQLQAVELDTSYFALHEVGASAPLPYAFTESKTCTGWAILRSHLLAGQFVLLHGLPPQDLLVAPTPDEVLYALDRELEHIERHVFEGDARNPYEATYAVWTGCRILYALATGSPVVSKRSAGDWGLANLPTKWHPAIAAAGRSYDGVASEADTVLLRENMAAFVDFVREHLPPTEPRPPGPPRWS